jgi:hypothetical protein
LPQAAHERFDIHAGEELIDVEIGQIDDDYIGK